MRFEDEIAREQQRFIDRYEEAAARLRRVPGVVSVGVGARERAGELVPELAFRVYVARKIRESELPESYRVPRAVFGLPTDVIVKPDVDELQSSSSSTVFAPNWDSTKYRPLRGGSQFRNEKFEGDNKRGMGTLGCLGTLADGTIVALTVQHVTCAGTEYNLGIGSSGSSTSLGAATGFACVGVKVGQPRHITCCCCCTFNEIGAVLRAQKTAQVDCATVKLDAEIAEEVTNDGTLNDVVDIGTLTGVAQAVCFSEVSKRGAATRLTRGTVIDVLYEGSQILIHPLPGFAKFAHFGDSGAVIVDSAGKVVGLLWGADRGSRSRGVANHIGPVLAATGIIIAGDAGTGLGIPTTSCGSSSSGIAAASSSSSAPVSPSSSSSRPVSSSSSSSSPSSSSSSSGSSSSGSSSSARSSSSSSSSSGCRFTVLGPPNVPGLSRYGYRISVPGGSAITGITWSVNKASAVIVGAANQVNVTVRFTNAAADFITLRADFTIDGNPGCAEKQIALVKVTVGAATFTNTGRPNSSAAGTKSFLVNPPPLPALPSWVTTFTPGSNCAAFVYNGTEQAAESRRFVNSNGAGGGAAYGASTRVTLTSPPERPTAHRRIQIGFVQHGSEAGSARYRLTGTRTVTVPAASALDWLSSPCSPGGTDEWPWYDQTARATGAGASPWSTLLAMSDSPGLSIPALLDPNHPGPTSANALNTAAQTFSVQIKVGVRTLDADLNANSHYFDVSHSTWSVNFAWPVVPGVSIVTAGPAWVVPPSPIEIPVNIVPAATNGNGPFLRWIPGP